VRWEETGAEGGTKSGIVEEEAGNICAGLARKGKRAHNIRGWMIWGWCLVLVVSNLGVRLGEGESLKILLGQCFEMLGKHS
jgi:hypothetical protein